MTGVLVLGGSGMLGHKVWQACRERCAAWATVRGTLEGPGVGTLDADRTVAGVQAEDLSAVRRAVDAASADVVVNCIGIVKQDPAASDPVAAIRVNSLFPHQLAAICAERGSRLIHVSTDCVFSGRRGGYREDDVPDADDLYGRSKLLGEPVAAGCLTLRTSIVGRELRGSHGLLEWLVAQRGGSASGFTRAIFSGLTTQALARLICELAVGERTVSDGLWHVSAEPVAKHDLLVGLSDALGLDVDVVPDDSVTIDRSLDSSRFRETAGWTPPSWEEMIAGLVSDPTPYDQLRGEHAHR